MKYSELELKMKRKDIPTASLIADIKLAQGSGAKSISYQRFTSWNTNLSRGDSTDSIEFDPILSLFNEQLARIPQKTSTRVVLLVYPPKFNSSDPRIGFRDPSLHSSFSTTYDILTSRYKDNVRYDSSAYGSDAMPSRTSQLGFDFSLLSPGAIPRMRWTINDCGNCKTMVIHYYMWSELYDPDQIISEDAILWRAFTVIQSFINNLNDSTNLGTQSTESNISQVLLPLIQDSEAYFLSELGELKSVLQHWIDPELGGIMFSGNNTQASRDEELTLAWTRSRGVIEGFEMITQNLEDYRESMLGIHENDKIQRVIDRHRKRLQRARKFEQYVRDTIQLNVGTLSLQESRKSIQKAMVLAFIFPPISLVTSFFGMNFHELTGSGASWKAFLIAAGILCCLGLLTFFWAFRKSDRLMFCVSIFFLPPFLVLRCLVRGLLLMKLGHGSLFDWLQILDFIFFYDFARKYHSSFPRSG